MSSDEYNVLMGKLASLEEAADLQASSGDPDVGRYGKKMILEMRRVVKELYEKKAE